MSADFKQGILVTVTALLEVTTIEIMNMWTDLHFYKQYYFACV